jgi:hypothetical protein
MIKKQLNNKRYLMGIGITIAIVFAYFETVSIWNGPWNWERLLSGMGFAAIRNNGICLPAVNGTLPLLLQPAE